MKQRLLSLDIVRGMTVAGMILVNNGYRGSFEALRHAEWNGLSLSDLVFPFFLFIMGVSLYLSLAGKGFRPDGATFGRIAKRTLLLFAIGIAINWLDKFMGGKGPDLETLRFWAVLQRIAVCYLIVGVFAITVPHRFTIPFAAVCLAVYAVIVWLGNGYGMEKAGNILYRVDAWIIGDAHLYHKSPVDPEGLLSTISSLANVLFGFRCGMQIRQSADMRDKTIGVFTTGSILVLTGFIVNFVMPYNKHIWSPSFALVTSGMCALLLALMMKFIDTDRKRGVPVDFFHVFGVNALALYISSELIAILFGWAGISAWWFGILSDIINVPQLASLCYALTYVALNFAIGYPLWKRRIYIKL